VDRYERVQPRPLAAANDQFLVLEALEVDVGQLPGTVAADTGIALAPVPAPPEREEVLVEVPDAPDDAEPPAAVVPPPASPVEVDWLEAEPPLAVSLEVAPVDPAAPGVDAVVDAEPEPVAAEAVGVLCVEAPVDEPDPAAAVEDEALVGS
jgi:hypothetical protein